MFPHLKARQLKEHCTVIGKGKGQCVAWSQGVTPRLSAELCMCWEDEMSVLSACFWQGELKVRNFYFNFHFYPCSIELLNIGRYQFFNQERDLFCLAKMNSFLECKQISEVYNKKSQGIVSLNMNISFPSTLYFLQHNDGAPETPVFSSEIAQNSIFLTDFSQHFSF